MIKKIILSTAILILFLNCTNKEVKLPTIKAKGIQELHNHSAVWMFYELKDNITHVKLNKNNTISSTHWIYNIDKRLPLKLIAEKLKILKYKHAHSMHSKEGMLDYFSYSDSTENKLSFINFSEVEFNLKKEHSKTYIQTHTEYKEYHNIHLTFDENQIKINNISTVFPNLKTTLNQIVKKLSDKKIILHLNFNESILYQDYLTYFTFIHQLNNPNININKHQFIFNCEKITDYHCD